MGARTIRVSQSHLGPVFQVIVRLEGKPLEQMRKNNANAVYIQRSPPHISRGTVLGKGARFHLMYYEKHVACIINNSLWVCLLSYFRIHGVSLKNCFSFKGNQIHVYMHSLIGLFRANESEIGRCCFEWHHGIFLGTLSPFFGVYYARVGIRLGSSSSMAFSTNFSSFP